MKRRFENERRLAEVGLLARRNGKTYTLILGMKANPAAKMIVRYHAQAKQLSGQYGIDLNRFICLDELDRLKGIQDPTVIDWHAIECFLAVFQQLDEYEWILTDVADNPNISVQERNRIKEILK